MASNSQKTQQFLYLGIDIAKKSFAAALLDGTTLVQSGSFDNTHKGFASLAKWFSAQLKTHPDATLHACMEATGRYGENLAHYLHDYFVGSTHLVSVVNAMQTSNHAKSRSQRNKTDKLDALNIAHFCATHHPAAWQPPTDAQHRLKELSRHLEDTEKTITQEKNRLEAGVKDKDIRRQIQQLIGLLQQQRQQTKEAIDQLLEQTDEFAEATLLLTSIPSVGITTAAKFLAEVQDVRRFGSADQLVAYAGLSPSQKQSGSSVKGKSSLSKKGNGHLRSALYMPIMSAMRYNPFVKALTDRLLAQGRPTKVAMAAGMRKLLERV